MGLGMGKFVVHRNVDLLHKYSHEYKHVTSDWHKSEIIKVLEG